jgi:hypothetical protein
MKTKEIQIEGFQHPVIIWKMNNGFKTDLIDKTTEITMIKDPKTGKERPKPMVKIGASRTYNLVYGILESQDLNIPRFENELRGLTQLEENQRLQAVRGMDSEVTEELLVEINKINNPRTQEDEEELEKK